MRRIRYGKSGSALFLCILTASAVGLCGVFWQASVFRRMEADLARAMRAQINAILVAGNEDLQRRYGLNAFSASDLTADVLQRIADTRSLTASPELQPMESFDEPGVFTRAVDTYMRYRLPGILLSDVADSIMLLTDSLASFSAPGSGVAGPLDDWLVDYDFSDVLLEPQTDEETGSDQEGEEDADEEPPDGQDGADLMSSIRQKIVAFLADRILGEVLLDEIQNIQSTIQLMQETDLGVSNHPEFPDLLHPNDISAFIDNLDDWLSLDADPLYQKLGHVAYIMGQCSRRLPDADGKRNACAYRTGIGNRDFSETYPIEGPDVERIVSGKTDAKAAEASVRTILLGIRFALSTVSIYADSTRLARARTIAGALSGVIALISAGAVVVPEPAMTLVVAAIWGFGEALSDTDRIIQGENPSLIPGHDVFPFGYDGYLRLFLLLMNDEVLMTRLRDVVLRNMPGPYYRALRISVAYRSRVWTLEGRCAE